MMKQTLILLLALALMIGCNSRTRRVRTDGELSLTTQPASDPDSQDATTRPAKPDPRASWPRTYDQAVTAILAQMTEDDRDMFASLPKDRAVLIYRDWPRQLAHQFGLPDNRELLDSCAARGRSTPTQPASRPWQISMHPERAATLIIEGAWERVQSK